MKSALIVVDVLNPYEHEDADRLMESVRATLPAVEALVSRARRAGATIVYVNDNYGDFSACRPELVRASTGWARTRAR